jgi:hypothetical protein
MRSIIPPAMSWRQFSSVLVLTCAAISLAACGSGTAETTGSGDRWGSYPADSSLGERGVVQAYVEALDTRDGARFCAVVAPWISGRFDIAGTDPDSRFLARRMRCPQLVSAFIGYIEDCCPPKFVGASIKRIEKLRRHGDLVGVPITVRLRLDKDGIATTETLHDVVWVTRDAGAWRVAKLSEVAAAASIGLESERDLTAPPDLEAVRRAYADFVAATDQQRRQRQQAYGPIEGTATCRGGVRYRDPANDVVDYLHPAPPTPTPQLPEADIRGLQVQSANGRICVVFELGGEPRGRSTFEFALQSPDFDWGKSGFAQSFEVELRADGEARVASGLDGERHPILVPGTIGASGNRLMFLIDRASFAAGQPLPGSMVPSRPLLQFKFRADVTFFLSERRYLHDDVPELSERLPYP